MFRSILKQEATYIFNMPVSAGLLTQNKLTPVLPPDKIM
jgi:hypothetical protein